MRDPYSVLGVPKSSSDDELKKAYRSLAKKLHPDSNAGDEKIAEKFKEVSAAYALLRDKDLRARYDRGEINPDGSEKGFAGGGGGFHPRGAGGGMGGGRFGAGFDPEEIFASMFGGGRQQRQPRPQKGQDTVYQLRVDFLDAIKGGKKPVSLSNGKTLNVTIPENVKEGQKIRLKGQGGEGQYGGPTGDAIIEILIRPHKFFSCEGNDIHLDLPITLEEAVTGAKVNIPTIDGKVAMTVPKGSSSGRTLRLKGKGARDPKSGTRGDQYVKLQIMLPESPDETLEKAIRKWAKSKQQDVRSHMA
ncbi:DnaJ C-terminal domain-containing protein [Paremcibacter congregatus]|uniref:Molecular chaperone DnaJ n=1 Tax=Paremcibacter congregatus TaxID=2043170 RepID=A0A2G4YWN9_9PROT|nr:J domain-containing protein [Paremcibacter congregatus]PHZ85856.1 molecular chaperone DnaJ [Paremcibacter congregatus]QDE26819.1 J domain-containing protein [Paremcibacter congregatus]